VGSGFRTFTAGEVLTASNVQNYLMDQSVMVFGGSAARSSAIGTANFEEGMVSYLTDTDKVEAYNGTNWVSVAPTTSQGLTLINTTSFSAVASQSINNVFSATYTDYKIIYNATHSTSSNVNFRLRVSGADDTTSNYSFQILTSALHITTSANSTGLNTWSYAGSGGESCAEMLLFNPFATANTKAIVNHNDGSANARIAQLYFNATTSFTGITIYPNTGTLTGSISVFGVNK
jgi:hypothetical protein